MSCCGIEVRVVPMDWAYLLNGFHGRIGRRAFWMAMIPVYIANVLACLVAAQIQGDRLSAIVDLAFTYPEFAIALKRAHDRNMPVWLLIVFFTANGVFDLFDVLGWPIGGGEPSVLSLAVMIPFAVLAFALVVELGFRRGTVGPNQYGPDPLAKI
jgi:uncharacterized membrane protein YhaH (DUF805 family)